MVKPINPKLLKIVADFEKEIERTKIKAEKARIDGTSAKKPAEKAHYAAKERIYREALSRFQAALKACREAK